MSIFDVRGKIVDARGVPAASYFVTILELDRVRDDLLGVVRTNPQGEFRLRFGASEIRQDFGEWETEPQLGVTLWVEDEESGQVKVIYDAPLEGHKIVVGQPYDLGLIKLPFSLDEAPSLEGVEPVRGSRAAGLELDAKTVNHAFELALEIVEAQTGWSLREALSYELTDSLAASVGALSQYLDGEVAPTMSSSRLSTAFEDSVLRRTFGGLYDPLAKKILINSHFGQRTSLESLIVLIGHELVHLGQFLNYPDLLESMRHGALLQHQLLSHPGMVRLLSRDQEPLAALPLHALMTDLEGHATFIEREFLAPQFGGAVPLNPSLWDMALVRGVSLLQGGSGQDLSMAHKSRQYEWGYQLYLQRAQTNAQDARFERGTFCTERELYRQERQLWAMLNTKPLDDVLAGHRELELAFGELDGLDPSRRADLMFQRALLLALDHRRWPALEAQLEELLAFVLDAYPSSHSVTILARYRAHSLLCAAGLYPLAWRFVEPLKRDEAVRAPGFEASLLWLEPDAALRFDRSFFELAEFLGEPVEDWVESQTGLLGF